MTRKVRLLLVAPSLQVVGGQSIQADHLLRNFNRGDEVEARLLRIDPIIPRPFRVLQRVRYLRTVVNTGVYLMRLAVAVSKADVVHIFSASYWSFFLVAAPALAAARAWSKPSVLHYHDGRAEDHFSRWRLARRTVQLASVVVVPSKFLVNVFVKFGIPAHEIPNILDSRYIRFRERNRLRPVFLHNRGMERVYNVGCALRAFSVIQREYPDASLKLAHDGSLRSSLIRETRKLGLRNVEFTGTVEPEKMGMLYDEADIYLTSADSDNMPGSILECFAAGLPVIATCAGGTRWLIRNGYNGLMVGRGDFKAIANAALLLLSDHTLPNKLTSNARESCWRYSWEAVAPLWLQLYSQLTAHPGSAYLVHKEALR